VSSGADIAAHGSSTSSDAVDAVNAVPIKSLPLISPPRQRLRGQLRMIIIQLR